MGNVCSSGQKKKKKDKDSASEQSDEYVEAAVYMNVSNLSVELIVTAPRPMRKPIKRTHS